MKTSTLWRKVNLSPLQPAAPKKFLLFSFALLIFSAGKLLAQTASITPANSTVIQGNTVSFTATAVSGLGSATADKKFDWSISPTTSVAPATATATITSGTTNNQSFKFDATGTYTVNVKITQVGTSTFATTSTSITVYPTPPTTKPFNTPIYSGNFKGGHTMFGNTIMAVYSSGNGNNGGTIKTNAIDNYDNMQFVNVDHAGGNPQGVKSASSAALKLPAGTNTIKFARLYWGGRMTNTEIQGGGNYNSFRSVKIRKGTSGAYTTLTIPISQVNKTAVNNSTPAATAYQSWADVTSFIQANGAGTYTVADIAASIGKTTDLYGNYAGWSIVVVYENTALDFYATRIYDAFMQVDNGSSQKVKLTGLNAPANPLQTNEAYLTAFTWEGDVYYKGDYLKINGNTFQNEVNPSDNMWNGSISETIGLTKPSLITTRTPYLTTSLAVDIDQVAVGTGYKIDPNATTVDIEFGTNQDQYFPSLFAFSMKVKDPQVSITKTAVDDKNTLIKTLVASQTITYVIAGKNTGAVDATGTIVVDSLPAEITYVPGTLQIVKSGTDGKKGMMTDAVNDDWAFYTAAAGGKKAYITFYVGNGSTKTAGGVLEPNKEYEVRFKAKTSSKANELVVINVAYVSTFSNILNQNVTMQATSALNGPQDVALAINLTSFVASKQDNSALLKWTTASEKNNDHFEIERSLDGVRFVKVGTVAGNRTTNASHSYQFADPLTGLTGIVYYRLKDVDIDGKGSYSKIVALHLTGSISAKTSVYPNPFTDNIKINVQSSKEGSLVVKITSLNGQQVITKKVNIQAGQNTIVLSDVQQLATGVHLLQIITEEGMVSQKVIKK